MHRVLAVVCLSVLVLGASCAHTKRDDGQISKPDTRYRIEEPQPATDWKRLHLEQNDFAYIAKRSSHSIAVNSTCAEYEDAPLEVLTQHLLSGFTHRELVDVTHRQLDARASLRSHYRARLDGVPIEMLLV